MRFYTKGGKVRPITPAKKKKKSGGAVLGGAVLACVAAATGNGGGAATVAHTVDSVTSGGQNAARDGNDTEAWRQLGLKEIRRTVKDFAKRELKCAAQSTGQVRRFFLTTPCTSLREALVVLDDGSGNGIVVSIVWAGMPSADDAARLQPIEDTYGTGDLTPLTTQALGLAGIRFTAQHYGAQRNGAVLTVAEAEPVSGRPSGQLLDDVAKVSAYLPAP